MPFYIILCTGLACLLTHTQFYPCMNILVCIVQIRASLLYMNWTNSSNWNVVHSNWLWPEIFLHIITWRLQHSNNITNFMNLMNIFHFGWWIIDTKSFEHFIISRLSYAPELLIDFVYLIRSFAIFKWGSFYVYTVYSPDTVNIHNVIL